MKEIIQFKGREYELTWTEERISDKFIKDVALYTGFIDGNQIPGHFFSLSSLKLNAAKIVAMDAYGLTES
jgi:hypothetical protein